MLYPDVPNTSGHYLSIRLREPSVEIQIELRSLRHVILAIATLGLSI